VLDEFVTLKGYEGLWVKKTGFAARFDGDGAPTVEEVMKAAGLDVGEIILAPAAAGKRYACPMHPEKVAAAAGSKCPACGMAMVEIVLKK